MTTAHDIDWPQVLAERLTTTHPDVLRELLATFIHTLMGAEADALCGAEYGQRSTERTNQRNGYRQRQFDTRTGTLDLAIPKLRHGSYFPDWLLERRKRAERRTLCYVRQLNPVTPAHYASFLLDIPKARRLRANNACPRQGSQDSRHHRPRLSQAAEVADLVLPVKID